MYRRDRFNEALVVERCAELVAIEARVSEIDALARRGAGLRRRQRRDLHLRRAAPARRALLPELRSRARRRRSGRRGHLGVSAEMIVLPSLRRASSRRGRSTASSAGSACRAGHGWDRCRPRPARSGSGSAASRARRVRGRRGRDRRSPRTTPAPGASSPPPAGASPRRRRRSSRAAASPSGRGSASGWTIVLASIPKTSGRDEAVAVAQQARTPRARRASASSTRPGSRASTPATG